LKKLLGLLVMSGAVLGALFLLTSLAHMGGGEATQAVTLKPASMVQEGSIVSIEYTLRDEAATSSTRMPVKSRSHSLKAQVKSSRDWNASLTA
jgi:hypothetical protein